MSHSRSLLKVGTTFLLQSTSSRHNINTLTLVCILFDAESYSSRLVCGQQKLKWLKSHAKVIANIKFTHKNKKAETKEALQLLKRLISEHFRALEIDP